MKKPNFSNKRGVLLKNTLMLYLLQFSTYALSLATTPLQTRVLGSSVYGDLGVATAAVYFFQLIIDFGFLLSATEEVSRERENTKRLSEILSAVTVCKLVLMVASFGVLALMCQLVPDWREIRLLVLLTFFGAALNCLMPDFLYRGLENMSAITVRTVLIRVFFTVVIFVFLRSPGDAWLIPVSNIIGNGVALAFAYLHVVKKLGIPFGGVTFGSAFRTMKNSFYFFISRFATSAYTQLNLLILDFVSPDGSMRGYYKSADSLIVMGRNALSPISDSMYPYMVKNRDFKLVKKVLLVLEPLIIVFCTVVFIFADPLCLWFFGSEYTGSGAILRAMLPVGVVVLPSYIFGFPTLTAMGKTKHANYSTIMGAILQVVMLFGMLALGWVNAVTLAASVSITETVVLIYRIVIVVKNRHLMKGSEA